MLGLDDGTELTVPTQFRERYQPAQGRMVTLGLRPEHNAAGAEGAVVAQMRVLGVEPLGPHTLLIGEVAGQRYTAQIDSHFPVAPDETVPISLDMTKMHLFDPDSGACL